MIAASARVACRILVSMRHGRQRRTRINSFASSEACAYSHSDGRKTNFGKPTRQPPPDFAKRMECVEACFRFGGPAIDKKRQQAGTQSKRSAQPRMLAEPHGRFVKYILSNMLMRMCS